MSHSVHIDDLTFRLLAAVNDAADRNTVPWMVTGATARVLLLERVFDLPSGRATQDVDFALMVESWEHYQSVVDCVCRDPDFVPDTKQEQRVRGPEGSWLDLIPFGGVEEVDGHIVWPPEDDFAMNVQGFTEAHADAIPVIVNDHLTAPVVSPVGLVLLKLFAWRDRHTYASGRDAADIAYVLRHFARIETEDRLFENYMEVLENMDYDIDLAAARVLGTRVGELAAGSCHGQLHDLLNTELRTGADSTLVFQLAGALHESERRTLLLVENLVTGMGDAL